MTVCIAGIHQDGSKKSIIAVSDQKVSFFGGLLSAEGVAQKIKHLNSDWNVMFSGDLSPMVPLLYAISSAINAIPAEARGVRVVARACSAAYREERKGIIENEILCDYDIDTYADYVALKTTNESLFEAITAKISEKEQTWSLLFCGFVSHKHPHIFVVGERGKIQYCDIEGFAAIGSGAWAAAVSLSSFPYKTSLDLGESMYAILAAKYASESADGVGEKTILVVLRPGQDIVPIMPSLPLDLIRNKWKSLPKVPHGAAEQLIIELKEIEARSKRDAKKRAAKAAKASKALPKDGTPQKP